MPWESMITVGRIVRPHGHRGGVVIEPESDFAADRFREGAVVWWLVGGEPRQVRIETSREFRGRWVVTLEGVRSMNEAEALRDAELRIAAEDVRPLEPGAHYVHDLLRCSVETVDGQVVGRVEDVLFGTGAPVLVVHGTGGDEVLVPLAEDICRIVDPANARIVIDPPEGLVELNKLSRSARK